MVDNIERFVININDNIPEPEPIISIGDTPVFTLGNFSIIGGKQKARKTFFVCMPVVAILKGEYETFNTINSISPKVLFFDCEQSKSHVHKVVKRIYRMVGLTEPTDKLIVYSLRELSVKERQEVIKEAVKEHKPSFVVLDGLVDVTEDFNAIDKSTEAIQLLMTLSSEFNCHITAVLHENKNDKNLKGHLGSLSCNKAESVIQLTKEGDSTKVEGTYTRNICFEAFNFSINAEGLPIVSDKPKREDTLLNAIIENMAHLLTPNRKISYTELTDSYVELTGKSIGTAKNHIRTALVNNIIQKNDEGLYCYVQRERY